MLYLNTKDIQTIGIDWEKIINVIEHTVTCMANQDFAQPIKPYLKYRDPNNRIIAMPAYVGGDISKAGIKWIASFPNNVKRGLLRANSVTILNDADTGVPIATLNTAYISGIRTAAVSGMMIRSFQKVRETKDITLGIIGFGPIGRLHFQMATALLGDQISKIKLFDIAGIPSDAIPEKWKEKLVICNTWEQVYSDADIFITCTVSKQGYINTPPKVNALLLNVSLRDFKPEILDYTRSIIVDDWDEVCRADTDIEVMHKERGLQKHDTKSIVEVIVHDALNEFPQDQAIMFHPMGMAAFDIATAAVYYEEARTQNIGTLLED